MKKNKKKKIALDTADILPPDTAAANSAEFVPSPVSDLSVPTFLSEDEFDFIPELKGNKFS